LEHLVCPDFERKREDGWTESSANEEDVVMRIAKLLAIFGIPALLIAASSPLLANDGGSGAGGGGAGGAVGIGRESSVSHATPGHAMHAALPSSHTRGTHHGASSFSPGHAVRAAFQAVLSSLHSRRGHHGASSVSAGHAMQAASSNPPTGHQGASSFGTGNENASTTQKPPPVPMSPSAAAPPVQPLE
jgi:hypothetical protein